MAADFTTQMKLKNDLWDFALEFYGHEGVEALCLKLQDEYGLSINRLILACWAGLAGKVLAPANFHSSAETWQRDVTHPVRAVRYQVRLAKMDQKELDACYKSLRQAELACEQVELALLYASTEAIEKGKPHISDVEKNLRLYLKSANQPIDSLLESDLKTLIQVVDAFQEMKDR